ncbi:MAG: OmpA family protein [Bacteroidota bacterium]|nr:OmpA family protein [Bacteroidota bacterium]MDP4243112.1 OmpA family protein [Bacteroidota bacterium]
MSRLLSIALLLLIPLCVHAQTNSITGHSYWGFDLGLTGSSYIGNQNFIWHIEDPNEIDPLSPDPTHFIQAYMPLENLGSGVGLLLGGKIAVPLGENLDLAAKLRLLTNHTSRDESQDVVLAHDPTTHEVTASASSSNSYALTLSNLSLAALLNFRLSDQFYGIGGFELSTLLSNSITLHQDLTDGSTYYYSGTGDRSAVSSLDHPASSATNYFAGGRAAVQLGAGTAFTLNPGSSTMFDVELLFSIPLTEWLTSDARSHLDTMASAFFLPAITYPKLWYASLTVGIRFPFGGGGGNTANITSQGESHAESGATTSEVGSDGKVALTGTVTDAKSGKPIDATMTVVDLTSNEVVATDKTDGDGRYNVRVKAPGKYSVTADANGHLFGTAYFEVDKDGRILSNHPDIKLSETTNGRTRLLVFFDFNSSDLKSSSYPELNRAVKLMKAVPTMQVEIAGYTDSVGSPEYNRQLSEKRANSVRDYLVRNGITKARVKTHGYGEESPIADNSTDEGRAENRRVEFVVLSK